MKNFLVIAMLAGLTIRGRQMALGRGMATAEQVAQIPHASRGKSGKVSAAKHTNAAAQKRFAKKRKNINKRRSRR